MYVSEAGYLLTSICQPLSSHLQCSYEFSPLIIAQIVDLAFQQKILSLFIGCLIAGKDVLPEFCKVHILTAKALKKSTILLATYIRT